MEVEVRPLVAGDLPQADRIFRLAFGTFIGLPDPLTFLGDADLVKSRWHAAPEASLGAYAGGELIGSNFAARWGSFGFFGPLTVRPDFWGRGVAQRLLGPTMELFERWNVKHVGLFTFPHSTKHVGLYQKFGFWPQALTAVMAKPVNEARAAPPASTLSVLRPERREKALAACRAVASTVQPGLDLSAEIRSVAEQSLGETVLVEDGGELTAFAVCHLGAGTEAGSGTLYVKFGAARHGLGREPFRQLLAACESLAHARGAQQIVAGVNTARHEAYGTLLEHGFRSVMHGIAMQRPNEPGFNRPDRYVLDDWR
jgi:GNAT superfamily N-acetyltransferase